MLRQHRAVDDALFADGERCIDTVFGANVADDAAIDMHATRELDVTMDAHLPADQRVDVADAVLCPTLEHYTLSRARACQPGSTFQTNVCRYGPMPLGLSSIV